MNTTKNDRRQLGKRLLALAALAALAFCPSARSDENAGSVAPAAATADVMAAPAPAVGANSNIDAELKAAFEAVVARYGNPTVVRIMTNDAEAAQEIRRRLEAMKRVEEIRAESERLAKTLASLQADVETRRKTVSELDGRIASKRMALAAFAQVVAMEEDAFRMSDGLAPVAPMIPNSETLKTTKAIVINPAAPTP